MKRGIGTQLVAVFVSLLLALSMTPVFDVQSAFADEPVDLPVTTGGDVPMEGSAENTGLDADDNAKDANQPVMVTVREDGTLVAEGLIYKSEGDGAVLVGFEDGDALEREVAVPERLADGALEYTVKGVSVAEGQSAPGVLSLTLPQTIEDVNTKFLAVAMPALARVSVDGRGGAYSSANGMLFKQESITASSDGSTTRIANRELVWAPPAMVIARVPGTCKAVASGAFTDDAALETVMVFSIVDSVAKAEKDENGNVTKEGAFTDEQVAKVNIVTPMETLVYPEGDRISADAFLAEDAPLNEKHIPWCDCGFSMERFTVGIPYGSTSLAVAVPEDGKVGTPEITVGHYTDHPEWDPKGDTGEPQSGLVFEYKADMTVSVAWKGDKNAVPSHLELPAYVIENGVKTAVTEVAPNAFEGTTQLENVVVPEGVTVVGDSAFAGCSNLKDASFPSTLKTIDSTAFDGCEVSNSIGSSDSVAACEEASGDAGADEEGEPGSEGVDSPNSAGSSVASSGEDSLLGDSSAVQSSSLVNQAGLSSYGVDIPTPSDRIALYVTPDLAKIYTESADFALEEGEVPEIYRLRMKNGHKITSVNAVGGTSTWVGVHVRCSTGTSVVDESCVLRPADGWRFVHSSVDPIGQVVVSLVPLATFNAASHIDRNVADLANYTQTGKDATYAKAALTDATTQDALNSWGRSKGYITKAVDNLEKYTTSSNLQRDYVAKNDIKSYNTDAKLNAAFGKKADKGDFDTLNSKVSNSTSGLDAKLNSADAQKTYVAKSDFGNITYSGLDGADASVYPSVYKKGGVPTLPAPEKDGFEFTGWTWGSQTTPTTDVASAFATGGNVELKANWEKAVPETDYFFSGGEPLDAGGGDQSHVIKVRITKEAGKSLSSVTFKDNDTTHLLDKSKLGENNMFWVNGSAEEPSGGGWTRWGGTITRTIELVDVGDGYYGLYVGIEVPSGAVNQDSVMKSYTAGDYVASLVTLEYTFA